MYSVLLDLQRTDKIYYYPLIKDYRKGNSIALQNIDLTLGQKFLDFPIGTNIHKTDLRSTSNYYNNVWINGLLDEPLFILQDYGNDSFHTKWSKIVFDPEDNFSIALSEKKMYLISSERLVCLGPHRLSKNQYFNFIDTLNTKRPFDISWENRKYMIVKLRCSEDYIRKFCTKLK